MLPHLFKKVWRKRFLDWAKNSDKIFLTFDDGPDSSTTGQILDLLKVYGIKATFFVIGENVKENPALSKRIIEEGHAIGIHSQNHLHPWKVLPWKAMVDLSRGNNILKENGINTFYVRPPFGKLNFFSLMYMLKNHLTFVHWNLDTHDYERKEAGALGTFLKNESLNGKVVLLHDGRRPGKSSGNVTVEGLKIFFQSNGYRSDLFSPLPQAGIE